MNFVWEYQRWEVAEEEETNRVEKIARLPILSIFLPPPPPFLTDEHSENVIFGTRVLIKCHHPISRYNQLKSEKRIFTTTSQTFWSPDSWATAICIPPSPSTPTLPAISKDTIELQDTLLFAAPSDGGEDHYDYHVSFVFWLNVTINKIVLEKRVGSSSPFPPSRFLCNLCTYRVIFWRTRARFQSSLEQSTVMSPWSLTFIFNCLLVSPSLAEIDPPSKILSRHRRFDLISTSGWTARFNAFFRYVWSKARTYTGLTIRPFPVAIKLH